VGGKVHWALFFVQFCLYSNRIMLKYGNSISIYFQICLIFSKVSQCCEIFCSHGWSLSSAETLSYSSQE
jgi:hypothetical protein